MTTKKTECKKPQLQYPKLRCHSRPDRESRIPNAKYNSILLSKTGYRGRYTFKDFGVQTRNDKKKRCPNEHLFYYLLFLVKLLLKKYFFRFLVNPVITDERESRFIQVKSAFKFIAYSNLNHGNIILINFQFFNQEDCFIHDR